MNNDLKHHGVKGMKWGVRRYQNKDGSLKPAGKKKGKSLMKKYSDSLDKANAKSAAGTAKRKAAIKAAPKKALDGYKNAMEKADAKSAAGTAKRKSAVKNAPKKALSGYKNALEKADAKSAERTAKRNAAAKKVGKEANRKLPNAAVGIAAGLAINSVIAGPAAMTGRAMFGTTGGALAGSLAGSAVAVQSGMKIYDQLMDNTK